MKNKNIEDLFLKQRVEIFAHVYTDIVKYLDLLDTEFLINIRKKLYEYLSDIIPLNENDLITSHNKENLEVDIYVLEYSLVNDCEHGHLKTVLKP